MDIETHFLGHVLLGYKQSFINGHNFLIEQKPESCERQFQFSQVRKVPRKDAFGYHPTAANAIFFRVKLAIPSSIGVPWN